jgi:hypothetical protein
VGRLLFGGMVAAAGVVAVALVAQVHRAGVYSAWLGGVPRLGPPAQTFEVLIKQAGFGLFPWGALAFFALGQPLAIADDERPPTPAVGARAFLLFFAGLGLACATLRVYLVGPGRFAVLAPVALALGAFFDDWLEGRQRGSAPLVGLLAAVGTAVVARDLFLSPEELVSVHLPEKVRWPVTAGGRVVLLAAGLAFAGALGVALGLRRRVAAWAALALAVALAAFLAQGLVPALSLHFSPRSVVSTFRAVAPPGVPLARFRAEGQEGRALRAAPGPTLGTREALAGFLAAPGRAFAVIGAEALAPVDQALRSARVPYAVLDASSARLLLLVNRLAPGESDQSPLHRHVFLPRAPEERPPWPAPRVPVSAVFAGAVELLGADFPESARRPGTLPLTLIFRVLARPPAGHGIFVHLEQAGEPLVNGDHQPVGGAFPTENWLPGEYIRDEHAVDLPLAVMGSGTYRLFVGLWPGGNRRGIPITAGATDGHDRCPLGTVVIR